MDKLKILRTEKLIRELDFIEVDYQYTNEVISNADILFMNSLDEILNKYPEIKNKYNKKLDEIINSKKQKDSESDENSEGDGVEETDLEIDGNDSDNGDNDSVDNDNGDIDGEDSNILKNNEPSLKIKKLYREIVKLTHPDKIKDNKLNEFYIEATKYYNENNSIGIYKICGDLNIEYDLDDSDELTIKNRIKWLKDKINFLESTFTWKWANTEDENERERIIVEFIKMKIN